MDRDIWELVGDVPWRSDRNHRTFYVRADVKVDGRRRKLYLHHVVAGLPLDNCLTDHENGNGLDCRRSNLRVATRSQNCANSRKQESTLSRFKGVKQLRTGGWEAICRRRRIAPFDTEEAAAQAYDAMARMFYGEFANTNFKSEPDPGVEGRVRQKFCA